MWTGKKGMKNAFVEGRKRMEAGILMRTELHLELLRIPTDSANYTPKAVNPYCGGNRSVFEALGMWVDAVLPHHGCTWRSTFAQEVVPTRQTGMQVYHD
jgi:hypothetical protein